MFTSFLDDSHHRTLLHDGWKLKLPGGVPQLAGHGGKMLPAEVPGCVHLDLMKAGLIDDPFRSDVEYKVRWIDETDWTYVTHFLAGDDIATGSEKRRQLVFEGLDTFAEITLDGNPLGVTNNMFHAQRFDLPEDFVPGEHTLEVHFDSPLNHVNQLVEQHGPAPDSLGWHRGWARKAGYSYGWDWGPELPSAGIFRPVYLQTWVAGRIGWMYPSFAGDSQQGTLSVHLEIEVENAGDWVVECRLQHGAESLITFSELSVQAGTHAVDINLPVENPILWWPHGSGDPVLHSLTLRLIRGGETVHEVSERIGLRTVEWVETRDKWGKSFHIRVNGRDIFAKGANWIPADNFLPRVTEEKYHRLLDQAVGANMNMLRVWGGGFYENPAFYRAADERGLMIWQDFMYACSLYPDHPDFRDNAINEARWVVSLLVRHPSIVLWCGNNEIERDAVEFQERFGTTYLGKTLWYEQLPQLLREMAPDVHYIPSSPIGGETANDPAEGDRHVWNMWSGWKDAAEYRSEEGRFISEFGFQAPADVKTWKEYLDPTEMNPDSEVFKQHNKQVDGPARIVHFLEAHHNRPESFEGFVRASQDVQARSICTAIDFWRSRRPRTMGTLIWQFNDCWPVTSWALLDSNLRPKASWYHVARSYLSRRVVLIPEEGDVRVVLLNDADKEWIAETRVTVHDMSGGVVAEKTLKTIVKARSIADSAKLPRSNWLTDSASHLLVAEVDGVGLEGRAIQFPRAFKDLELPESKVNLKRVGESEIEVSAESYAFGVWVWDKANPDLMFSDNALDLLPGESVRLQAVNCATGKPEAVQNPSALSIPY